ncbi:MAG: non-hydrolyzing UDP-N-acetylglucosamine 2-epimerase, partial [Candidatus Jordarchaeum sp.]|uniref:non-hydrolyzing UDP-N-acetylglucosamine 2-epimerase n=1 Tax=Candidatus Jordarchaeum sp. TaxID=2823881 RepID=UPI00404B9FD1
MKIAPLVGAFDEFNLQKKSGKERSKGREVKNKIKGKGKDQKEGKKNVHIHYSIVHTGQHYDEGMSEFFFRDLGLPEPDIYLGVGSGSHAEQTARIMMAFEKVCLKEKPDLVMVVGDVNSTVACALVAAKLMIPVAHVEAGLRSFDRSMPEEINRLLTDLISDFLFTTCEDANRNLIREGIPKKKIHFVGNVMIDTLRKHLQMAKKSEIIERLGLSEDGGIKKYALLTLHRPSNVDDRITLRRIFGALNEIASRIPIIFPIHPRTLRRLQEFRLNNLVNYVDFGTKGFNEKSFDHSGLDKLPRRVLAIPPLGYLDFLCLMSRASLVLTDSGGIQEETTILGIPCLTLRNNTERPITITQGTNCIVGNDPRRIKEKAFDILKNGISRRRIPRYWDGKAA